MAAGKQDARACSASYALHCTAPRRVDYECEWAMQITLVSGASGNCNEVVVSCRMCVCHGIFFLRVWMLSTNVLVWCDVICVYVWCRLCATLKNAIKCRCMPAANTRTRAHTRHSLPRRVVADAAVAVDAASV